MNTKNYLDRLRQINRLIALKTTGKPAELAKKLNISERALYNYIEELKQIGLPISWCKELQSYIYTENGSFIAEFKYGEKVINNL